VTVTIDNLGKWPGPAPMDDLLGLAETSSNPNLSLRALTGVVQLATAAGSGHQAPDAAVVAWFQRAGKAVRSSEDRRVVISGLGRWTQVESLRLLLPYLDDGDLGNEAASAILSAAGPVAAGPDCAVLKPVLERISGMGSQFLDRVSNLKRTVAATESAMKEQKGRL
jgi:hypothetical protein